MTYYHMALFAYLAFIAGAVAHKTNYDWSAAWINSIAFVVFVVVPAALGYLAGVSQ